MKTLLTIVILSVTAMSMRPIRSDFSGTWNFDESKSENAGSSPKTLKLTETKDSLLIERTESENKTFVEKLSFDGKTNICTTTSGRRKSGTAQWNKPGSEFTENAVLGDRDNPDKTAFTVVEHWVLSDDGTEVTVETKLSNAGGALATFKAVYNKQ
jgi:hypothetical protein